MLGQDEVVDDVVHGTRHPFHCDRLPVNVVADNGDDILNVSMREFFLMH